MQRRVHGKDREQDMKKDETDHLQHLGAKETTYLYDEPSTDILETFPNPFPHNEYTIEFTSPEFTSLCPKTGQPDFAAITIRYSPKEHCIETKSLKLYLFSYRQHKSFMETCTNMILNHLYAVCEPRWMTVEGHFTPRGGISPVILARRR
jgi:7-cyano-7-deazaguanine reductase